jgi:hypothetical protein
VRGDVEIADLRRRGIYVRGDRVVKYPSCIIHSPVYLFPWDQASTTVSLREACLTRGAEYAEDRAAEIERAGSCNQLRKALRRVGSALNWLKADW